MEIKYRSAIPIYVFAAVFILFALFLPMYRIGNLFIALGAALLGLILAVRLTKQKVFIVKKDIPEPALHSADKSVEAFLREGEEYVQKLEDLDIAIPDPTISAQIQRMVRAAKEIYRSVHAETRKLKLLRRFHTYYFPMAVKLLTAYVQLPTQVISGESHVQASRKEIEDNTERIAVAFEKQLDSLYQDKALDISTDIDVLKAMMASEGMQDDGIHNGNNN